MDGAEPPLKAYSQRLAVCFDRYAKPVQSCYTACGRRMVGRLGSVSEQQPRGANYHMKARTLLSRLTTPLWPLVLVALLIGAVVGGLAFGSGSPAPVTALVQVHPPIDPNQILLGNSPATEDVQNYLAGEVAFLESAGFADSVAAHNGGTSVPFTASQNGQSQVITFSASSENVNDATQTLNSAIDLYSAHVQQVSQERANAAVAAINDVLTSGSVSPNAVAGLRIQRDSIKVLAQRPADVQVIQSPAVSDSAGVPGWVLGALAGGLLAGLLTLGGGLVWRKYTGVVTSPSSLSWLEREDDSTTVLTSVVRVSAGLDTTTDRETARRIYALLPEPRQGAIVTIGASEQSPTAAITSLIAGASSEDPASHDSTDLITVVDAGALGDSPALPADVASATQVVIVAEVGRDYAESVRNLCQISTHAHKTIVCTRTHGKRAPSDRDPDESEHAAQVQDSVWTTPTDSLQPDRS